jgi:hypothetical protein
LEYVYFFIAHASTLACVDSSPFFNQIKSESSNRSAIVGGRESGGWAWAWARQNWAAVVGQPELKKTNATDGESLLLLVA